MRTLFLCAGIIAVSLLCSCGRPTEEIGIKPAPAKSVPEPVSTAAIPSYVSKLLPEGFEVTVLDADNGTPVTNASVRFKWYIDYRPYTLDAITLGNGVYRICTTQLFKNYSVGVMADGYIPNSLEKPAFPLTIQLHRGNTVKMSGTVYGSDGNTVSGAYIAIRPLPVSVWANNIWLWIQSCETYSDANGHYTIPTLPPGFENLCPRFCHASLPMLDLTNYVIDTCHGDLSLDIYLPEYITFKGQVRFDTGEPVTGAVVWIVKIKSDLSDRVITRIKYSQLNEETGSDPINASMDNSFASEFRAVPGSQTRSDSNGFFTITLFSIKPHAIIKAQTDGFPPAWSGIYGEERPVPAAIDLVISTTGSRLCGRFSDMQGQPVTNAAITYSLTSQNRYEISEKMIVKIEPDGSYISEILEPGQYHSSCSAPGYVTHDRTINILRNTMEMHDIVFEAVPIITGRVVDIETKLPIPGVNLSLAANETDGQAEFTLGTDENGMFWIKPITYPSICFSHPAYATNICNTRMISFNPYTKDEILSVYMSAPAKVIVFVDAIPSEFTLPHSIKLIYNTGQNANSFDDRVYVYNKVFADVKDGRMEFNDVPKIYSPVRALLFIRDPYIVLSVSDAYKLQEDTLAEIHMNMPALGTLRVTLTRPFDTGIHRFTGLPSVRLGKLHPFTIDPMTGCEISNTTLLWRWIPTNTFTVYFDIAGRSILKTNIVIQANQITDLFVDLETNLSYGIIKGTVALKNGNPLNCTIFFDPESEYLDEVIGRNAIVRDGVFSINDLNPEKKYTVALNLGRLAKTNIVVSGVKPNGPSLEIVADKAYRVTGTVVDGNGQALYFSIPGITSYTVKEGPGPFTLYPVFPGVHKLTIRTEGYAPVHRWITVRDADIDIGEIVMIDGGCTLKGTLIDTEGNPLPNFRLYLSRSFEGKYRFGTTDVAGRFTIKHLPYNMWMELYITKQRQRTTRIQIPALSGDKDLGEIEVELLPKPVVEWWE